MGQKVTSATTYAFLTICAGDQCSMLNANFMCRPGSRWLSSFQVRGKDCGKRVPTVYTRILPPGHTRLPRPGGHRLTPGPFQVCAVAKKERAQRSLLLNCLLYSNQYLLLVLCWQVKLDLPTHQQNGLSVSFELN